jgi:hypothetical protein
MPSGLEAASGLAGGIAASVDIFVILRAGLGYVNKPKLFTKIANSLPHPFPRQ